MTMTPTDAEVLPAPGAAPLANGLDPSHEALDSAAAEAGLAANGRARVELRRAADRAGLRLAVHDLAEGLRGVIRIAPFASVILAAVLGMRLSRRRPRRPPPRSR